MRLDRGGQGQCCCFSSPIQLAATPYKIRAMMLSASRRYSTVGYPCYQENPDFWLPNPLADRYFRFSFLYRENRDACGTDILFSPPIRDALRLTALLTVHRPF